MTLEEYRARTQEILSNPSDPGRLSALLAELTDAFTAEQASRTTAETNAANLTAANESLRSTNMQLFLRVGAPPTDGPSPKKEPEPPVLSYDKLFDEKGRLK